MALHSSKRPASWRKVYYIRPLLCWSCQWFVFSETDTCFWYGFAFPCLRASPSTTLQGLLQSLIHRHGIPHNIASDHEIPSQWRNCGYVLQTTGHVTYFIIQKELVSQSLKTEGPPEVPAWRKYFTRKKIPPSHMHYMHQIRDLCMALCA